ncbi:MAG: hypothetical protein ACRD52_13355 [Candidatus Acidiferrales bacterium]
MIHDGLQQAITSINDGQTLVDMGAAVLALIPGADLTLGLMAVGSAVLYNQMFGGTLSDYQDAIDDPALFNRLRCAIQTATSADGYVTSGNFAAVLTAVSGVGYAHSDVISTIHDYLSGLGADGLMALQQPGGLEPATCIACDTWGRDADFRVAIPSGWFAGVGSSASGIGFTGVPFTSPDDFQGLVIHSNALGGPTTIINSVEVWFSCNSSSGAYFGPSEHSVVGLIGGSTVSIAYMPAGVFSGVYETAPMVHMDSLQITVDAEPHGAAVAIARVIIRGTGADPGSQFGTLV